MTLLVVRCGALPGRVGREHGAFDAWFARALKTEVEVACPYTGQALPDARGYGGVILTGALESVRDEAPWMAPAGQWALSAADRGVPVLGVCFGTSLQFCQEKAGVRPARWVASASFIACQAGWKWLAGRGLSRWRDAGEGIGVPGSRTVAGTFSSTDRGAAFGGGDVGGWR